ncbi:MAG: hypothetical protein AAFV95_29430 [Bacteroidota bacterium]
MDGTNPPGGLKMLVRCKMETDQLLEIFFTHLKFSLLIFCCLSVLDLLGKNGQMERGRGGLSTGISWEGGNVWVVCREKCQWLLDFADRAHGIVIWVNKTNVFCSKSRLKK